MGTCTLQIGRVVLRSEGGPPDAEYVLFDPGEIELRATEPGNVREHGYQTTADKARLRLESAGLTVDMAHEAARAMKPALATAYARGASVRRLAGLLGPQELLEARTYDAAARCYRGTFLDLGALATDLALPNGAATMQALYLRLLVEGLPDDAEVLLTTTAITKDKRPGHRTYHRVGLELRTVHALTEMAARGAGSASGPALTRSELLHSLRERASEASDDDARERVFSLIRAANVREMPARGPLADPELWEIEMALSDGETSGVLERLEAFERIRGRAPATTYLRARAALILGTETPKLIAERVSALALSMTSFAELELLAAQSWAAAGDMRRALPYARDLVDSTDADDDVRARARVLADQAEATTVSSRPKSPSAPPVTAPRRGGTSPGMPRAAADAAADQPPRYKTATDHLRAPLPASVSARPHPLSAPPVQPASQPPADSSLPPVLQRFPSQAPELVIGAQAPPPSIAEPRASAPPPDTRRRNPNDLVETRGPASLWPDPRAEPEAHRSAPPEAHARSAPPPGFGFADAPTNPRFELPDAPPQAMPARATPLPISLSSENLVSDVPEAYMRGGSQPPYRTERPPPNFPRAPLLPKFDAPGGSELAEHLALPPGITGHAPSLDVLPHSVLDARVQFTLLSRELGLDYRLRRGIELRTDVKGIEAMQSVLLETFPDHAIRTPEEASEVRRHGAFLSEILARNLEAEWVDIGPTELGHWAMIAPPGTRVWPFGRVIRLIAMAHKERDLVSYYLELQNRQHPPR